MSMWLLALPFLAADLAPKSAAPGLYEGTIRTEIVDPRGRELPALAIIVLLEPAKESGRVSGRYFYWKQRKDIAIDGALENGILELTEHGGANGAASGTFVLRSDGADWKGTWTAAKAGSEGLETSLHRVDGGDQEQFERHRAGKVSRVIGGGYPYEWRASRKDPLLRLPFLVGFANPAVEKKVNAAIEAMLGDLGCDDPGTWETKAKVTFAEKDLFSVSVHSEHDCGGPYPTNDANSSFTFDLKTGTEATFAALFGKPDVAVFAVAFKDVIHEDTEGGGDGECPEFWSLDMLAGSEAEVNIEPEGVRVEITFNHAMEACEPQGVIPFSKLTGVTAPKALLRRLAQATSATREAFVASFVKVVLAHDWTRAMEFFDEKNRADQRTLGVEDTQYLLEAIGPTEFRRIKKAGEAASPAESAAKLLGRIRAIEIRGVDKEGTVSGVLTLDDGRKYEIEWYVVSRASRADTAFAFEPASG